MSVFPARSDAGQAADLTLVAQRKTDLELERSRPELLLPAEKSLIVSSCRTSSMQCKEGGARTHT